MPKYPVPTARQTLSTLAVLAMCTAGTTAAANALGETVGTPAHASAVTPRIQSGADTGASAVFATEPGPQRVTTIRSKCLNSSVPLSAEETRLNYKLPRNDNPALLQLKPFAQQMIDGAGFHDFGPQFAKQLCRTQNLKATTRLAQKRGVQLWRMAVERAQSKPGTISGGLPASDDRPLYWTRLQVTAAIRQWTPRFGLSIDERDGLITAFDKASRGMTDISYPGNKAQKRIIVSGFDPYTLDGGERGSASGAAGNNIRHGNPSGAIALALDGTRYKSKDGATQRIEAYTLPVNYTEFGAGYLEDTVGPLMRPGRQRVDASITVSQAGGSQFNLEQWNARYHGVSPGNDLSQPCRSVNGAPQLAINNHDCNTQIPRRWGGPLGFDLNIPPQWTTGTLPVGEMIRAHTGRTVPRPPGDTWPDQSEAFGVVWHTNYTEFSDCTSAELLTRNSPVPTNYPPETAPIPPDENSCSYSGGGGNYLSNESAYRNTRLRDYMGLDIPAGHIHTPGMQNFDEGNRFNPSDATFDAWRRAITAQAVNLVHVVGENT